MPAVEADLGPGAACPEDEPAFRVARDPSAYRTPDEVLGPQPPQLTEYKSGFFQKLSCTGTEIVGSGSEGLNLLETELYATLAVPAPTIDFPLLLIPTLEATLVDAPAALPLPSTLYATYLDLMWLPQLGAQWRGMLAVAPGWYSDFDGDARDAFRLTGRAIVRYDWIPDRFQVVLGTVYVNRIRSRWIPAGGIIWKPTDDWNFDLVFPRAKLARRLSWGPDYEHWAYLAGGFGGNNWQIHRPDGSTELLALRDWRLMIGWERKYNGGAGFNVELGYVFAREIELPARGTEVDVDATMLFRAGLAY
jgi:hypothetical protein